mmetsp:Transcript_22409/g.73587  ORF Transcript_22409/g.73587 Transcript_22409/m.73587 type:complete len:325 (-) Transcript_22409:144-1118(-)
MFLNCNHSSKAFNRCTISLLEYINNVTRLHLFIFGDTFDGKTNRITWLCMREHLLMLFNRENLLVLQTTGNNSNFITGFKSSLLNCTTDNLTNTLNIVDIGDWKTHRELRVTGGRLDEVIQTFNNSESCNLFLGVNVGFPSLVPGCFSGFFHKIITMESRVRNERNFLWLESNQLKHLYKFFFDLKEALFVPAARVHLINSHNNLIYTKKVQKPRVLTGLPFLYTSLGISFSNRSLKTTFLRRNKQKTDVCRGRSSDHVFDVILVSGCINNCVVILFSEKFFGVTLNGNTTLSLLFTGIQVVSETERRFTLLSSQSVEFVHLTL